MSVCNHKLPKKHEAVRKGQPYVFNHPNTPKFYATYLYTLVHSAHG